MEYCSPIKATDVCHSVRDSQPGCHDITLTDALRASLPWKRKQQHHPNCTKPLAADIQTTSAFPIAAVRLSMFALRAGLTRLPALAWANLSQSLLPTLLISHHLFCWEAPTNSTSCKVHPRSAELLPRPPHPQVPRSCQVGL